MDEQPVIGSKMVSGWRKFFTRSYWKIQWICLRWGHRPLNIVSVGKFTVPDEALNDDESEMRITPND